MLKLISHVGKLHSVIISFSFELDIWKEINRLLCK